MHPSNIVQGRATGKIDGRRVVVEIRGDQVLISAPASRFSIHQAEHGVLQVFVRVDHDICPNCLEYFSVHNDDGSCVEGPITVWTEDGWLALTWEMIDFLDARQHQPPINVALDFQDKFRVGNSQVAPLIKAWQDLGKEN